jgi:transposase-like protein
MSTQEIRFCPKCKSINVGVDIGPSAAFGVPQKWKCYDCGFEAFAIFPVREEEQIKDKAKLNTKNKK